MSAEQNQPGGRGSGRSIRQMYRTLGIGIELAAVIGGMTYAGYFIDQRYDTTPWACAIGSLLGIVVGCYNVIKEVMSSQRRK